MTNYTHDAIRAYMADEANGTICEASLVAIKNLESAIYKRASISPVELEAISMIIQCADELRQHIANKRVDNTRKAQPRELREGLKREHVERIISANPARYSVDSVDYKVTDHVKRETWDYSNGRATLIEKWY